MLENFSDLSSEYYSSNYILKSNQIRRKKIEKLANISFITDGEHGTPDYDDTTNIKYITAENIRPNYILDNNFRTISAEQDKRNSRAHLLENDVLVYSVGAYAGYFAKAERHLFPANIPRSVAIVRPNRLISPEYLSVFMNSKFGYFQTQRFRAGNSQPVLALEKIKQFEIVILGDTFQNKISEIYNESYRLRLLSKTIYSNAENILLKEIDLDKNIFDLSAEDSVFYLDEVVNTNVKSFKESFKVSGRLDAEYYQKKYDILEAKIRSQKFVQINNIKVENFRGLQPIYFEDGGLDIINSKHILEKSIDYDGLEKTDISYWYSQERARVFKGDILTYTTGANIGRTQVYSSDKKALGSNHVNILRVKNENPLYIGFVMNSIVGRMQTEKLSAGSAQAELYPKDVDNFLIPIIEKEKQTEIIKLLEESSSLKKKSEHLLKVAEKAVEVAIEEDENLATEYIKKNV